ncbi:Gfo/Idh/MocA family protein [Sulfuriroseicoccus oceanibius]|uniref:Gfo/Idh/MocA family oxidoreductase n=1 Tax=Sulfuriroseicoccus oceanibius TaxID=2707525 RepID=A0A7T7JCG6_9BACT|nr:Gfo/Idh/MocA family oxidoreductase [Sulfuriroseicoccus oceanibius]QQL44996.1 Gfo/Idh/MocA family oxidoreductase [Sulfuriroseicoccus oceanibius]
MKNSDTPQIQGTNRRSFLKMAGGFGAAMAAGGRALAETGASVPALAAGSTYMGDFVAPKLDKVKVAFIGCGARGGTHYHHISTFDNTEVVGICDIYEDLAQNAKKRVLQNNAEAHKNVKLYFGDKFAYKQMLAETKPDVVYVITPWEWHAPMAIDAMNAGAHAMVEVPLATSIEDCWKIIETSEKTKRHCMMLENVNYGRDELMFLNMARQGVFGELLHGEAAYIHELRGQMHQVEQGRGTGFWRTHHWAKENGNLYPTHGLGPVAQYMNLARGDDNFRRLVSFSSPAKNHALYAKENFAPDSKLNQIEYNGGDMSTSIIKTELGRTIMVQWDESSPRPYSRHNLIQGTRGTGAGFPNRIALDYTWKNATPELRKVLGLKESEPNKHSNYHAWLQGEAYQAFYEAFDHPLYTRMEELAKRLGGHGGMDAIMNYRVIECIRTGQPLDQNVYEGAFWSAVTPLSRKSVAEDGMPQDFPDFTRGQWKNTKPLPIVQ